jgi:hypothetical protein
MRRTSDTHHVSRYFRGISAPATKLSLPILHVGNGKRGKPEDILHEVLTTTADSGVTHFFQVFALSCFDSIQIPSSRHYFAGPRLGTYPPRAMRLRHVNHPESMPSGLYLDPNASSGQPHGANRPTTGCRLHRSTRFAAYDPAPGEWLGAAPLGQ